MLVIDVLNPIGFYNQKIDLVYHLNDRYQYQPGKKGRVFISYLGTDTLVVYTFPKFKYNHSLPTIIFLRLTVLIFCYCCRIYHQLLVLYLIIISGAILPY